MQIGWRSSPHFLLRWSAFTLEEFGFDANMCINHTTGIPASNYSVYDYMVRMSKLGVESIVDKAHAAMIRWLIDSDDAEAAAYWEKTWSMTSGHGRWAAVHSMYAAAM